MQDSNLPVKGMDQDTLDKFQQQGSYKYALNAVLETKDGAIRGISNEEGNTFCGLNFPTNKKIIGHVITDTDDIVLFLFDPASTRPEHEIGLYNPISCTYTTIAKGECLNFKSENQINALFKIRNSCDKFVYFTDNLNPYRVINITDTTDWVNQTTKFITDCNKIKFSRPSKIPHINPITSSPYYYGLSDSGGSLEYGTYSFAIRLIDYDNNPTDFINISRYYPVVYGNLEGLSNAKTYNEITGAVNVESETAYKPKSSKSIGLSISNIDTRFSKYQIAVIKRTSSSGAITGVDLLTPIDIENPSSVPTITSNFIYTGSDLQFERSSSIEEVLSERLKLDKVVAHTQADNRLLVAGLSSNKRDYTSFQRHASSIKVEYTTQPLTLLDQSFKTPEGYINSGFPHDEVVGLGIVYLFEDGPSPVFHIPGRPIDITTVSLAANPHITGSGNLDSHTITSDDNLINPTLNKRWQVYNTYTKHSSSTEGYLGYYHSSQTYKTVTNPCDTHPDGYWGRDFQGNLLTGNVRHHRLPSFDVISDKVVKLGLKFTMNSNYPHPDIIGHYYVITDPTLEEKTVMDYGVSNGIMRFVHITSTQIRDFKPDMRFFTLFNGSFVANDWLFLSSIVNAEDELRPGQYLRVQNKIGFSTNPQTPQSNTFTPVKFTLDVVPTTDIRVIWENPLSATLNNSSEVNLKINTSNILLKNVDYQLPLNESTNSSINTLDNITIQNKSNSVNFGVHSLDRPIETLSLGAWWRSAIKSYADVYSNIDNLRYVKTHDNPLTKVNGVNLVTTTYSGSSFMSLYTFADNHFYEAAGDINATYSEIKLLNNGYTNPALRMNDERSSGQFSIYKNDNFIQASGADGVISYLSSKLNKQGDVIGWHKENFTYSKAYDFYLSPQIFLAFSDYDLCDICNDSNLPYRIYYSNFDSESKEDKHREILVNNYRDIDASLGPINDLFTFADKLYCLTRNSCLYVPFRPQTIQSSSGASYLGTGEFLSLPIQELKTTEYSFGGTSHFKSRVSTEYGVVYMDDISSRPFIINDSLNDLSLSGMRNFFQENGRFTLVEQFKKKNIPYLKYSTSSDVLVGYITTYEPRYKRVIIHKKDFKINDLLISNFTQGTNITSPNTLWWDGSRFVYNNELSVRSYPKLNDPYFFDNKSFTISYSFLSNSFVSFHSYLPEYIFNNHRNIFSNSVYKHEGSMQTFYGKKYDFIVDFIQALDPKQVKTFSHASIRLNSWYLNSKSNTTFDRIIAYTSNQSTGVIFTQKDKLFDLSTHPLYSPVKTVDNQHRINSLRDITVSNYQPIWTTDWTQTQFSYPIDKVPDITNLNSNSSLFNLKRLRDYYLGLRLFFNPSLDIKFTVDITDINFNNRNR